MTKRRKSRAAELVVSFSSIERVDSNQPPERVTMPWTKFTELFANPDVRDQKAGPAWSPATFPAGARRSNANVEALNLVGLDIDDAPITPQAIQRRLNGYAVVCHTSYSSKPGAERFRIIIPLDAPVPPSRASAIFEHFNEKLGGILDPACKDPARVFYAPAVPPGYEKHYGYFVKDGDPFDASSLPDAPIATHADPVVPSKSVPKRFWKDLKQDSDLRSRWDGDVAGLKDDSRSGLDMALAKLLANRGYPAEQIAAVLLEYPHGKAAEAGEGYISRTVRKAVGPEPTSGKSLPVTTIASEDEWEIVCESAEDVVAEPVPWLWFKRIARKRTSLIAGDPGVGKTTAAISLGAIVSSGGTFPDGSPAAIGKVIIFSAEDEAADTLRPRLEAAGANLSNVRFAYGVRRGSDEFSDQPVTLDSDVGRIERLILKERDVSLVIVDPISAFLGNVDSHRNAEVRALLGPLSKMAARTNVAIVAISHLNKGNNTEPLQRVTGSLAFTAASRATYLVVKDRDAPGRCLFLPAKNNLGDDQTGFAFSLLQKRVAKDIEASYAKWESAPIRKTAREALADLERKDSDGRVEEAAEFLRQQLASGPKPVKELEAAANGMGISWAAVRRAKSTTGVDAQKAKGDANGGWTWKLRMQKF